MVTSYRKSSSLVLSVTLITLLLSCTKDEYYINLNDKWDCSRTTAINGSTFAKDIDFYYLRIPFCEVTNRGTIIVGADIRENSINDITHISIGIVRSEDGGKTFKNPQIIIPHTNHSIFDRAMDATILVDRISGRIFVFAHHIKTTNDWVETHYNGEYGYDCVYVYSDDDGMTWTTPHSFMDILKGDFTDVITIFGGVGHGITMEDGTLVLPVQCKMATKNNSSVFNIQSGIAYSKDRGETWQVSKTLVPCYCSENMVVEHTGGFLINNCRSYIGERRVFITYDLGATWVAHPSDRLLIEPIACQGSFHKKDNTYYFVNPHNSSTRNNILLQESQDCLNWSPSLTLEPQEVCGYSCLCHWNDNLYAAIEMNGESIDFFCMKTNNKNK